MNNGKYILGVESSCDDTAAAVCLDNMVLSNVIANQKVHEQYGGVVPELASRAHQANIVPVVTEAMKQAGIKKEEISAIAYTRGPGLLGSLLVGSCFAKSLAQALKIPAIEINHMQAHILAHFAIRKQSDTTPTFPFLCLTVSGGHTQIVKVESPLQMKVIGQTLDDAAGEAFDKISKVIGLPYPGGPLIDKNSKLGNPLAFKFNKSNIANYDFSFSGFKTNVMNFIHNETQKNENFLEQNLNDICASVQHTIVNMLMDKIIKAAIDLQIKTVVIAGGVSANSLLRSRLQETGIEKGWNVFIPPFEFCTDNAAMIAVAGYFKYSDNKFSSLADVATARYEW